MRRGHFSDFFESLFAGARAGGRHAGPGGGAKSQHGDTRSKLTVPLEAIYSGGSVRVTVNGRQLDVRVPKGIQPGKVIRLNGQGSYARHLLLEIEYAPHPQFEVDGHNILHTVQVTPWQAALGTSISVPTLEWICGAEGATGFRCGTQVASARSWFAWSSARRPDR